MPPRQHLRMECERFRATRLRLFDELTDNEMDFVFEHPQTCESCRAAVEQEKLAYLHYAPEGWPCQCMARHLAHRCDQHADPMDCADCVVAYRPSVGANIGGYGIPVRDGENAQASSWIEIRFCPWCGTELRPYTHDSDES